MARKQENLKGEKRRSESSPIRMSHAVMTARSRRGWAIRARRAARRRTLLSQTVQLIKPLRRAGNRGKSNMKTLKLIKRLSDLHVRLWVEGEKLKWKAPEGIVRDELLAEIRESKSEILDLLKAIESGNGGMEENPIPVPKAVKRGTGDFTLQYRPRRISEVFVVNLRRIMGGSC
jgi:hypothetical protein